MSRLAQAASALAAVMRSRNLRRVELAWGASIAAEWAHFVALGVFAYAAGGTQAVGIAGLVRMLPAAIFAPLASSLGDRFRRERFMLAISFAGSCALAASALAYFGGKSEVAVFALAGVVGVTSTLFRPALQAILPSLARSPEELIAANGASSTIESLGTLVGPLLAGALVALANPGVVFATASGAMLAATALLVAVRVEGRLQVAPPSDATELILGGAGAVARSPRPRLIVGLLAAQGFVRGCLNVLIVVVAFRVLHTDGAAVGYLTAALGVGGLLGAFGALTLEGRRLGAPLAAALVFWGVPIALVAPRPFLGLALILLAVVGAANSVEDVAAFTLLQRLVPDDILSRVLGVAWGLVMGAVALGSVVAPPLVSALGPRAALAAVGALLPVIVLLSWRRLAEIDRDTAAPQVELLLVGRVPMFAPLSVAAKEHVAAKLTPLHVEPGQVVVRKGDTGDTFYIVADGQLEVTNGVRSTAGAGDVFGEIALLRDVPRTATVTASTPANLFVLGRDDFLAAVTGQPQARAAGEALVEERLASELTS